MTNFQESYTKLEKAVLKRIDINELPKEIPNFKNSFESKDSIIKKWLSDWIVSGFKKGKLEENSLLPKKADLAYYLGVSVGTVQNAIRCVEDSGLVESKQRIGTVIRNASAQNPIIRKSTSKREKVITEIKKYIVENALKAGDSLPSARQLATITGHSTNTVRLALENLSSNGIIEAKMFRTNDANWTIKEIPQIDPEFAAETLSSETLVKKVEKDLKDYISANHKVGDRLPAHFELSEILKVSIKTVHDAMKGLIEERILLARRGRYGTTIIRMPGENVLQPEKEISIFAKAEDAQFYSYQKIENEIKTFIKDNFEIGEKLPSMENLAQKFDVSSNTIRKALQNLSKQGFVQFSRGRYGGTFVSDIPEAEDGQAFRWLAVSPDYTVTYDEQNN